MTFVEYLNKTIRELNGIVDTTPAETQIKSPIVKGLEFDRYIVLAVEQNKVECNVKGVIKPYSLRDIEKRYAKWQIRQKEKREKEKLWKDLSDKVKERDSFSCTKCGASKEDALELHAHHIKPRGDGGDDSIDNLTTLCIECHAKAHSGTMRGDFLSRRAKALRKAKDCD